MSLKSIFLHREQSGYTIRFYKSEAEDTTLRYVFTTAEEALDFILVNVINGDLELITDDESEPGWWIPKNPEGKIL